MEELNVAISVVAVRAVIGETFGRRYGLQLEAERAYVGMVGHLEECVACDRAGGELASRGELCPAGRRARDAWERSEGTLVGAAAG